MPAWPTAVETGQPGISPYGISTRSSKLVGEAAEPAPEHHADARHELRLLADPAYGVVEITTSPRRGARRSG